MTRNRWISDLNWVRTGQQSRSQATQQALLDAATMLFAEQGIEATSVAAIARKAGCSVGAVYHHFRDKQTLLYAIFDRMTEETEAMTASALTPARWQEARIRDILEGYLQFSLETGRQRAAVKKVSTIAAEHDPVMAQHLRQLNRELKRGLARLLLTRRSEIGHPDPELAVGFCVDQLGGCLRTRLGEVVDAALTERATDRVFIRETLQMALSYLRVGENRAGRR